MRKFKLVLFVLLMVSLMATVFTGCLDSNTPESEKQSEQQTEISLTLSEEALTIEQYEQATLTATLTGATGEVVWASSDEEVASVLGGVITAKTPGTTNVTATYGDKSATCVVTVTETQDTPVLYLEQTEVSLFKGSSK